MNRNKPLRKSRFSIQEKFFLSEDEDKNLRPSSLNKKNIKILEDVKSLNEAVYKFTPLKSRIYINEIHLAEDYIDSKDNIKVFKFGFTDVELSVWDFISLREDYYSDNFTLVFLFKSVGGFVRLLKQACLGQNKISSDEDNLYQSSTLNMYYAPHDERRKIIYKDIDNIAEEVITAISDAVSGLISEGMIEGDALAIANALEKLRGESISELQRTTPVLVEDVEFLGEPVEELWTDFETEELIIDNPEEQHLLVQGLALTLRTLISEELERLNTLTSIMSTYGEEIAPTSEAMAVLAILEGVKSDRNVQIGQLQGALAILEPSQDGDIQRGEEDSQEMLEISKASMGEPNNIEFEEENIADINN